MAVTGGFEVHGGAHGVEADMDDMDATGGTIRSTGFEVVGITTTSHAFLVDANLLSSAVLSPGTFADFETTMLSALDGPGGLAAHGLKMTAAGLFMQGQARAYLATDQALALADDLGDWVEGYTLPLQLAWRLSPAGLPGTVVDIAQLADEGLFTDPQQWLLEHPDDLEELVASTPGFVSLLSSLAPPGFQPLIGFPLNVEQGAGLLAGLYDQELGSIDIGDGVDRQAPVDLVEVLERLERVNASEDTFQIEQVGDTYNIYLPGTKEFDAPGPLQGDLIQNMGTNLAAVGSADNAYVEAVLAAMAEQIPEGATVNFVGHSQGGIVAARLAELIAGGDSPSYDVQSVVTAGSPVDGIDVPEDVQVISLVNEYDIVPRLDGEAYGDKSNHTTIVFEDQNGSVGDNHGLGTAYGPAAEGLVDSTDPAIVDALSAIDFGSGASTTYDVEMHRK